MYIRVNLRNNYAVTKKTLNLLLFQQSFIAVYAAMVTHTVVILHIIISFLNYCKGY